MKKTFYILAVLFLAQPTNSQAIILSASFNEYPNYFKQDVLFTLPPNNTKKWIKIPFGNERPEITISKDFSPTAHRIIIPFTITKQNDEKQFGSCIGYVPIGKDIEALTLSFRYNSTPPRDTQWFRCHIWYN